VDLPTKQGFASIVVDALWCWRISSGSGCDTKYLDFPMLRLHSEAPFGNKKMVFRKLSIPVHEQQIM
jgi:hypothetical protein